MKYPLLPLIWRSGPAGSCCHRIIFNFKKKKTSLRIISPKKLVKLKDDVHSLTLWMLCIFLSFCRLLIFFKVNFLKKFFQEHYQSVKRSGSKLFVKGYQQITNIAAKMERCPILTLFNQFLLCSKPGPIQNLLKDPLTL